MTLSVSPTFRLKPQTGQAAPINELGAHEVLAGGTFSLVDRGTGDLAWQFSGTGDTKATLGAFSITPATGCTLAVTLRVVTQPTVDFTRYVMYTDTGATKGMRITQNGANNIRAVSTDNSSTALTTAIGASTSSDVTYVMRIGPAQDVWVTTASRSGTAANVTTAIGSFTTADVSDILIRAAASDVIQIKDLVLFPGKLTDTECAALADNLRGTLDAAAPAALAASATAVATSSASLTTSIKLVSSALGVATTTATLSSLGGLSSAGTSVATVTVVLTTAIKLASSAVGIATSTATLTSASSLHGFTTPVLKNNAGAILANETGVVVNVYNPTTGVLVLHKTGLTSDSSGIVSVFDAALAAATTYAYEVVLATNGRRLPTATTT